MRDQCLLSMSYEPTLAGSGRIRKNSFLPKLSSAKGNESFCCFLRCFEKMFIFSPEIGIFLNKTWRGVRV